MSINVAHGGSPAAYANAVFAGGQGLARKSAQDKYLE